VTHRFFISRVSEKQTLFILSEAKNKLCFFQARKLNYFMIAELREKEMLGKFTV